MPFLTTRLRAGLLFYRSAAPFMLALSGLILGAVLVPALQEGWSEGLLPGLLLTKLATTPVVAYLSEKMRPGQYWLYYNLNMSRRRLWAGVVAFDMALFLVAVLLVRAAFA